MSPSLRKLALLTHVTFSVGWLGAVAAYLALALVGLNSTDAAFVRGAYVALELMGWYVIVPFCLAGLVAGLVQSLGTEWGLFRHYWIATKFVLSTAATAILLGHMRTVSRVAALARVDALLKPENAQLKLQLVVHAALGLAVLVVATVLSIYKPWGRTAHGRRVQNAPIKATPEAPAVAPTRWGLYFQIGVLGLVVLFVVMHLTMRGLPRH
jgi:hypothetical protein